MKSLYLLLVVGVIFAFSDRLPGGVYSDKRRESAAFIQIHSGRPDHPDLRNIPENAKHRDKTLARGTDRTGTYIRRDKNGNLYIEFRNAAPDKEDTRLFNAAQARQISETETKVRINGNQVLVPVALGYRGKEGHAEFLLDTGASIVVLHRELADFLSIQKGESAEFMVPGGRTISTDIAVLDYIGVGPFRKQRLRTAIIDHRGNTIPYQGLLGMNFLRHFQYRLDFKRQVIIWDRQ